MNELDPALRAQLQRFQRTELTEHLIYRRLASCTKSPANAKVLNKLAADEFRHAEVWRAITGVEVKPDRCRVWWFTLMGRVLGLTFAIKLLEAGEGRAQEQYLQLPGSLPDAKTIMREEHEHEDALIAMIDEERLRYAGSVVLGLNDALVELTGALAGLTLALQNTRLIALTGLITGIAAALSMAASEYLSTKSEETSKHPLRASLYTGTAYLLTVTILITPYLVLSNYFVCLAAALVSAVGIIAGFNYYIAVAKGESFRRRFVEMAGLSFTVAVFSFGIGFVLRRFLGVDL